MSKPTTTYIKLSAVRGHCRALGKRIGRDFAMMLDDLVRRKINAACSVHNGGKKTLDASVAGYVGITNKTQNT